MFWLIAKREIYDNMTSLRFGFTVILLVLLMIINAATFMTKGYRDSAEQYIKDTAKSRETLRDNCRSIYNLALEGPGNLYKKPSPLTFCADGGEEDIPGMAEGRAAGWGRSGGNYSVKGFWRMTYPSHDRNLKNIMPEYLKTDWAFIIGVLASFAGILFTFDAISREKQRGTLRLVMAGSVPRSNVIAGKFFGAFISIMLPLITAILLNLIIINISGAAELGVSHWAQIGLITLISAIYISIFICLGIFISSLCSQSSTSLLILLLIWVVFVVLTPGILGSISSGLKAVPSTDEVTRRKNAASRDLWKRYEDKGLYEMPLSGENMEAVEMWAECLDEERQTIERLGDEHLDAQLAQIQLARQITRASPTAIYRYALEGIANTGFTRHCEFIANVRIYRDIFWNYIKSEDQRDPDSHHAYFVKEGLSKNPADFGNAPKFIENASLIDSLNSALMDMAILILFATIFFMLAFISFTKIDI